MYGARVDHPENDLLLISLFLYRYFQEPVERSLNLIIRCGMSTVVSLTICRGRTTPSKDGTMHLPFASPLSIQRSRNWPKKFVVNNPNSKSTSLNFFKVNNRSRKGPVIGNLTNESPESSKTTTRLKSCSILKIWLQISICEFFV